MHPRSTFPTNRRIAFTGRFASLSRSRAIEILTEHGGLFRSRVSQRTDVLVIGADGWPLQRSGTLTKNLTRANRLAQSGHPIEVMSEAGFLRRIEGDSIGCAVRSTHTVEQLSRLIGVSGLRIRRWIELGLVQPSSDDGVVPTFDFQSVSAARLVARLIGSGVPPSRLAGSLRTLRTWLPDDQSLSASIVALEQRLLVRTHGGQLIDYDGQTHFQFDEVAGVKLPMQSDAIQDADELFDFAFAAEQDGRFDEAVHSYQRWEELFGYSADVCFNLANVLVQVGQAEAAMKRYRQVVHLSPDHATAWNNLGLCEYREGETASAIKSLQNAVSLDPQNIDTLYNLADTLDEIGNHSEAASLWKRIVQSQMEDEIVQYAHQKLESLECTLG